MRRVLLDLSKIGRSRETGRLYNEWHLAIQRPIMSQTVPAPISNPGINPQTQKPTSSASVTIAKSPLSKAIPFLILEILSIGCDSIFLVIGNWKAKTGVGSCEPCSERHIKLKHSNRCGVFKGMSPSMMFRCLIPMKPSSTIFAICAK